MKNEPKSLIRSSWRADAFWRPASPKKDETITIEWRTK